MMHLAVAALLALAQTNDKAQANGYDDAWKDAWRTHCRLVLNGATNKTPGFVLQIGDSITHSNPYCQWPKGSIGKTQEDIDVCTWALTTVGFPASANDPTSTNGFYLAVADTRNDGSGLRGMTASSGIDSGMYVSGNGNGGTAMPSQTVLATAQSTVADGSTYPANLHITTVANAFAAAQVAVVMLGTNDVRHGRTAANFIGDLTTVVNTLEGMKIAVVLSTIPPLDSLSTTVTFDVTPFNAAIRNLAQTRGLPLIDFYAEILARRPNNTWLGTLIDGGDGTHPTPTNSGGDPYSPGGDALTNTTGTNCLNGGYLLRSWLTMQKLKEVQSFVIVGNPAVPANPTPAPPAPTPTPTPSTSSSGGGGGGSGHCGGSVAGPVSPYTLLGAALAALILARAARKTGF